MITSHGKSDVSRSGQQTLFPGVNEPKQPQKRRGQLDTLAIAELLREELGDISARMAQLEAAIAELHSAFSSKNVVKDFYTTAEIARILGKAKFTVREWCRNERIRAERGISGRGVDPEWRISHAELQRIQNEGLLPSAATRRRA